MRRFKKRGSQHLFRKAALFCRKNGQLLFMVALIVTGFVLGVAIYSSLSAGNRQAFASFFFHFIKPTDFLSGCTAAVSSAFSVCVMLMALFLLGLTAYGCPLILLVPLFFGFWFGVSECYTYQADGFLTMVLTILPYMLISAAAILIATVQAVRMSFLFSRQLLPSCANCGGMWQDFKWYLLRFLFCVFLAFAAAVVRVLTQLW